MTSTSFSNFSLLIVGAGSTGKRHAENARTLGVRDIAVVDPRADRRAEIVARAGSDVRVFDSEDAAYASGKFDAVIVATPPVLHLENARRALAAGAHVLIETNVTRDLSGFESLLQDADAAGKVVAVNEVYRFADTLQKVKELVVSGAIGKVYATQTTFSEYLPDWHPFEKPSEWYAGRRDWGGSELWDEAHAIDWTQWMFGPVVDVSAFVGRVADVTADSDDLAELVCRHSSGVVSSIHLDCFGRKPRKDFIIYGERGVIFWDSYMGRNCVEVVRSDLQRTDVFPGTMTRNDYFVASLKDFLDAVSAHKQPTVSGAMLLPTLNVCAAAEQSSRDGVWTKIYSPLEKRG